MSVIELEWLAEVVAEFRPRRVDDLKPDRCPPIGEPAKWTALWVIERGPYEGEWAMQHESGRYRWVPSGDLR